MTDVRIFARSSPRMNSKTIGSIGAILLTAACSNPPKLEPSSEEPASAPASVLSAAENPVQFRSRFIESHEILESCKGFPFIAKNDAGIFFYSTTGTLGSSAAEWKELTPGKSTSIGGSDINLQVTNTIPILSSSSNGKTTNCAVLIDPNQAQEFAYRISSESNANRLFMSTLNDVINNQRSIGQPVNLTWAVSTSLDDAQNSVKKVESINAAPGKRAVNGYFALATGNYSIDPRCRDIFNTTPEASCSSALEIDSTKLILE